MISPQGTYQKGRFSLMKSSISPERKKDLRSEESEAGR